MRRIVGVAVLCAAVAVSAAAQMRGGVPASVTSFGFGGHHGFGGVPASVTSPGFGFVPRTFVGPRVFIGHHPRVFFKPGFRHGGFFNDRGVFNRNGVFGFGGGFAPFFPAPYVVPLFDYSDYMDGQPVQPQQVMTQPAQPQPIVIVVPDRSEREAAQADDGPPQPARERTSAPVASKSEPPPPPAIPTIVVLRSGEKLELTDYAVTGDTLYDLHGGRAKKIAVSDIDLPATMKVNEERGLEFSLPNAARVHIQ